MKLNRTIILVVIGSVALNLQSGCQEAEKNPRLQQKITATPSETTKVVQDKKQQEKKIERASIQVQAQKPQQSEVKKAVIKVTEKTHHFGKVAPNRKYDCEFKFTNVGDATLKITRIQSTCGCTVPQLKKKSYEPGESGTIKVTFRTPTRQGSTTKRLYILSNDKKNPRLGLTLKATVELKVDFEPKSLDLSLKAENADAKPITIKSKDGKPFAIKSITTTRDVISADFDSTVENKEFVIVPKVNMDELKNNLRGSIRINVTHPEAGNINIPYSAKALFDISRPRIVIQNADPEKPVLKTVWITSNYGDKIEIESVSSQKGHIELLSREYEENGVKCEVRITPPQQTNESKRYFRDELKIKIKNGKDDLSVFCNGWYPREPAESK
ncbi:MAG TPA: DUF1573 domain-containing protein [Planctomycetes bacterium]|nr:DUF1573 domain-containing protein [Planctomycetota bacterium]